MIALIALPCLGIVGFLGYYAMADRGTETTVIDENADLKALIKQVDKLEDLGRAAIKASRSEAADASEQAEAFMDKADKWMDEWDVLTKPLRDKDGRWKPEYEGYKSSMSRLNTIRNDVIKGTGF